MNTFLEKLNNEQKKVVLQDKGKAVCIAGPGSGKTRVIVLRSMRLLTEYAENKQCEKICLTLAYNKTAAEEMKTRAYAIAAELFGDDCEKIMKRVRYTTIHSYCYEIIRRYCTLKSSKMPEVLDDVKKADVVAKIYVKVTGNTYVNSEIVKKFENYMKSERDNSGVVNDPLTIKIAENYKAYKEQNNYVEFDDMIDLADKILRADDGFCKTISRSYEFVQVDEAQDLSGVQARIISLVSGDNVMYVADDDQSIYGFRGAVPEILKEILASDKSTKLFKLQTNYRSGNEITRVALDFIEQNRVRFKKKLRTEKSGGSIKIETFLNAESEALCIARRTLQEIKNGRTVGILYRNNSSGIIPILMLFIQAKMKNVPLFPTVFGQKTMLSELKFINEISKRNCDPDEYDVLLFSDETRGKRRFYSEVLRDVGRILKRHTKEPCDILKLAASVDAFSAIQSKNNSEESNVTFSTMHSAKGLEFDTVFIVDCVRGEFPHCDISDKAALDEERRLMYVAMTRAKSKLYVMYPQKVGNMKLTAGQFVEELAEL